IGWQNVGRITIDLELKDITSISGIALNVVKNEAAKVEFPLNINLFFSLDGVNFTFGGDINANRVEHPKGYKVFKLTETNINKDAKYIKIIIIPHGGMFFTDEVNVYGKNSLFKSSKVKTIDNKGIEEIVERNKQLEINR